LLLPANKAKLVEVLAYHVAEGKVLSTDLKNGQKITTLDEKKTVAVNIAGKSVKINVNDAEVTKADVVAVNGVIHIIDAVLIPPGFVPPAYENIPEVATANTDLSTLVTALTKGGLVDTLSGTGPFTVFAPTNEAFKKLPVALLGALLLPANKAKLVEILEYHVAKGKVLSTDLRNGQQITTLDEKKTAAVTITDKTIKINDAEVTKADVVAVNGVVHIIDSVLIPPGFVPPAYESIPEIATADADLSTLVTALTKGALVDLLSGAGPFTVFAPTNEAFKKLPAALLDALLLPANKAKLVEVLAYHVAKGKVLSTDLKNGQKITTLDEKKIVAVNITGETVKINDAEVTKADVMAVNGVVHIIDAVLIPPGFVPPTYENFKLQIDNSLMDCKEVYGAVPANPYNTKKSLTKRPQQANTFWKAIGGQQQEFDLKYKRTCDRSGVREEAIGGRCESQLFDTGSGNGDFEAKVFIDSNVLGSTGIFTVAITSEPYDVKYNVNLFGANLWKNSGRSKNNIVSGRPGRQYTYKLSKFVGQWIIVKLMKRGDTCRTVILDSKRRVLQASRRPGTDFKGQGRCAIAKNAKIIIHSRAQDRDPRDPNCRIDSDPLPAVSLQSVKWISCERSGRC